MKDHIIFCDGISGIAMTGNMVRIDLSAISPQRDPSNRPVVEFQAQLVMPPESFLQAFGLIQKFVATLKEKGVVSSSSAVKAASPSQEVQT